MVKIKSQKSAVKIILGNFSALGPGKIELINAIEKAGSISGAAKLVGMSYRRAWNLVDRINHDFATQIIVTNAGGRGGGGASVSPVGLEIIDRYKRLETKAMNCINSDLEQFIDYLHDKSKL